MNNYTSQKKKNDENFGMILFILLFPFIYAAHKYLKLPWEWACVYGFGGVIGFAFLCLILKAMLFPDKKYHKNSRHHDDDDDSPPKYKSPKI